MLDADYLGPVVVSAWNRNPAGTDPIEVQPGDRIAQTLGWKSEHGLDDIVRSAVEARSAMIAPDVEAYPEV